MYNANMASGGTHEGACFYFHMIQISILLDEDKYLEKEITHLFNEVSIFYVKFEKKNNKTKQNQALNKLEHAP